ncbi:hypothetical protein D9757_014290 [Collybiopsis confluens]|uniref:Protein kinase domain-containing protein n=1 Tax=Collybiopsis confluens TaxID=2823264 RepID=A0A8H5D4Y2_9AGAR|nr:hypothetical protein D9757_014290 [Collybiopsis confluens]
MAPRKRKRNALPLEPPAISPPTTPPLPRNPLPDATSNHVIFKQPHAEAAQDMAGRYERISIKEMMDLLPRGPRGMPKPKYKPLIKVSQIVQEINMYDPFIKAMQPYLAPGWELVNSSAHLDVSTGVAQFFGGTEIKPDLSLYAHSRKGKPPTNSSEAEGFGEVKIKFPDNPFPDHTKIAAKDEKATARDTRGQIARYINSIQASQQRTRVFFFFILNDRCRLLCHSRAGTQYTDLFKYTNKPYLHEFFWRLSHGSPAACGHDSTFVRITSSRKSAVKIAREKLNIGERDPLYQISIGERTLYVSRAFTVTHTFPIGRGTRCFAAYDPTHPRLVLLKDCWRHAKYNPEHTIYEQLRNAHVSYIPGVLVDGDVTGNLQKTEINGYKLIHYRLVLDILGEPITSATSTYAFCHAISTALVAHQEACNKANLLHRDISVGNIILYNGQGYLINWERAKLMSEIGANNKDRTGTWQFLSIQLLKDSANKDPEVTPEIRDDLESFVHVMAHMALRYAANALTPAQRLHYTFNYANNVPGQFKHDLIRGGFFPFALTTRPFRLLLDQLTEAVNNLYQSPEDLERVITKQYKNAKVDPAAISAEIQQVQTQLLSHNWVTGVINEALKDEAWKSIDNDWGANKIQSPYADDIRAIKKIKNGHEYSQDLSAQRASLSVMDFE